jgi:hypothetical protein
VSERSSSYQPEEDSITQSLTDGQQLAVGCLTSDEIQLSRRKAEELALVYPLDEIRAACLRFIDDGRQPRREAGLVAHWLECAETLPAIGERHRAGDWWQRHRTPAEVGADEARQQALEAQRLHIDRQQAEAEAARLDRQAQVAAAWRSDFPHTPDLADLWSAVVAAVLAHIPAVETWRSYLASTEPVAYQAQTLTIAAATQRDAELLNYRLRKRIADALTQHNALPAEILFVSQQESSP